VLRLGDPIGVFCSAGASAAPVVVCGTIYVGVGKGAAATDPEEGEMLLVLPVAAAAPLVFEDAEVTGGVFALADATVFAADLRACATIWFAWLRARVRAWVMIDFLL
jgi:hypothetical protein